MPDQTLNKPRIDATLLADLVEIMSRNGRRAVVKLDDRRVDSLADLSPAEITAATEVDVSSFWVNPDRPAHGRRHFVYFLAGPTGAQYFGDSVSPEVKQVCQELDAYFGRQVSPAAAPVPAAAAVATGWSPRGWVFERQERFIAALALAALVLAVVAFSIGRWTVPTPSPKIIEVPVPVAADAQKSSRPATDEARVQEEQ